MHRKSFEGAGEHPGEIGRPRFQSIGITQADLLLVETLIAAQELFEAPTQVQASACEAARDAGFVFVHDASDLLQGEFLEIIEIEPHAVARLEFGKRERKGRAEGFEIARAIGFWRVVGGGLERLLTSGGGTDGGSALLRSIIVDKALSDDRFEPGAQGAASVKIGEERTALAGALFEAIQIGVERVGEIASAKIVAYQCMRRREEHRAIVRDEVVPCRRETRATCASQHEILGVETVEVLRDGVAAGRGAARERAHALTLSKRVAAS